MNLRDFTKLKATVESLQSESDRLEGARRQQLKELRDKHGCRTVEEAKAKLTEMQRESIKLEAAADKALRKFEAEYGGRVE